MSRKESGAGKWGDLPQINKLAVIGGTVASVLTSCAVGFELMTGQGLLPVWIATAIVFVSGRIADQATTSSAFNLDREIRKRNLKLRHTIIEQNPTLSLRPTDKEIFGRERLLYDIKRELIGIAIPPVGFFWGVSSWVIAIGNFRAINLLKNEVSKANKKGRS